MSRRGWLSVILLMASWTAGVTARGDNRVLLVGIDGAGGSYFQAAATPNIDALAAAGGVSYKFLNEGALVANPPGGYGASGVNWSTITTGASAAHHGVTDNSFSGSRFDLFPHFFAHVKALDPSRFTASIVDWAPINTQILADQYADLEIGGVSDTAVRDAAVNLLQTGDPDVIFLHFDQVDAAGHSAGWGSATFQQAIQNVDALVGNFVTALNARPGVVGGTENWLVIVTADHGGAGTSHDASQGLINWEVPFIVSGPSVPDGAALVPGTLRDAATTALWHLGVDPFSVPVDGRVVGLTIGSPNGIVGDVNQDGVVSGDGTGLPTLDDVTAFVAGWMSRDHASVLAAYTHGDLNLDRVTNLDDWIVLNRLNPAMGRAALRAIAQQVPEPASGVAAGLALVLWRLLARRLRPAVSRACMPLAAGVAACAATTPARATLTDNLVGLYEFSGNLLDTSGSSQTTHGQGFNGPQYTSGKVGQALWLPGVRDYVSLPSGPQTELDFGAPASGDAVDFSMAMWIRQDDFASDPAVLSNKDWDSGANTGINWAVNGNGIFDLNTKADVGLRRDLDTAVNSAPLAVGAWNLVVVTVDRDSATRLYINGVNRGTIPQTSQGDFNGSLPWNIGQDGTGVYGVEFTGAVDELAVWRRALAATEADALWNSGAGVALGSLAFDVRLKLVIDRDSGSIEIVNNTGVAQELLGYEITSAAGTLNRGAWQPIAGRLDAAGNGSIDADDRWVVLSAAGSKTDLSEASLGEGTLPQGATIGLGSQAWTKYHEDVADITFRYATPDDATAVTGIVEFVGNGDQPFPPLDLDFNGAISEGDYAPFLAGYGTSLANASAAERHNRGDLDGDGAHTVHDFLRFKSDFDALRASSAAAASRVPEPGCLWIATFCTGIWRTRPSRFGRRG